jgi:cell division transport system permease protein
VPSTKQNTKALQQKRRTRRKWITFIRMVRYGISNFTRNAWLTVAATAVMTITLLIVFMTVAAQNVLTQSVEDISKTVDMSIYLKTETTIEQAEPIMQDLRGLSNTSAVAFISAAEARQKAAEDNRDDDKVLDAISEATNKLPATLRIQLVDFNDTSELDSFVTTNQNLQPYLDQERDPSFAGERRESIKKISGWTVTAERIGLVASIVFIAISSLIIFNTIRMAIFSRKEEIQMMKLIGADKQFIRGPFVVEAIVYGFIAALIATGLGYGLLVLIDSRIGDFLDVAPTIDLVVRYLPLIVVVMVLIGATIGVTSSLLATRRYLKI